MAKQRSIPLTYVDWLTIPIAWVIGLFTVLLIVSGGAVYWFWLRPMARQKPVPPPAQGVLRSAAFAFIQGRVEVKRANEYVYQEAHYRMRLSEGDFIRTGSNGMAEILCPNGSRLKVHPDTLLRLECSPEETKPQIGRVEEGAIVVEVADQPGLVTTKGKVQAHLYEETIARIRFLGDTQESFVEVQRGRVRVQAGTSEEEVGPSEGVRVAGQGPIQKQRLLEPPVPRLPAHRQQILMEAGDVTNVTLEWAPVPNAVAYEVEVSSRPNMFQAVRRRLRTPMVILQIPNQFAGIWYFWRVRAIDRFGFMSDASEIRSFTITRTLSRTPGLRCPFEARRGLPFARFVIIEGRTHPSCLVTIAGDPVNVQSGGQFRYLYELRRADLTRERVVVENPQGVVQEWVMEVWVDERGVPQVRFYPTSGSRGAG